MKQTAVEWLAKEVDRFLYDVKPFNYKYIEKAVEQAKEMEKEQIMEAWFDGTTNWDSESSSEQYYNETFKPE